MEKLFFRTLKDRLLSLAIYIFIAVFFLWLYIALFPSLSKQAEQFKELSKIYPESFVKALNLPDIGEMFSHLENFLAGEQYSFVWPIMAITMMIAWAGALFAGEAEKGTIFFLLSQPLSRIKIFFAKVVASFSALFIFAFLSILSAIPLANLYDIKTKPANHFLLFSLAVLFGLVVFNLTLFLSTLFSQKDKVYFFSAGLLIIMYVLNVVVNLKENLENLKYFSLFYYFDTNSALIKGEISTTSVLVMLGVSFFFLFLALFRFIKRDY